MKWKYQDIVYSRDRNLILLYLSATEFSDSVKHATQRVLQSVAHNLITEIVREPRSIRIQGTIPITMP